ncbi:type II 3-dehydroquinate dehydratase [Candidatus Calescamantes bacterium]|nr:type II 3-dehydroquinate dehydratase [Candidatus Calescamantes bacterium]
MNILVIHGPNLGLLGRREPEIYGKETLEDINSLLESKAEEIGVSLKIVQSDYEGKIVEVINASLEWADGIIINPAAYTHTSVAIRDALVAFKKPSIEVHLSNVYAREEFRHYSYISPVCTGKIVGLGKLSYLLALEALVRILRDSENCKA